MRRPPATLLDEVEVALLVVCAGWSLLALVHC